MIIFGPRSSMNRAGSDMSWSAPSCGRPSRRVLSASSCFNNVGPIGMCGHGTIGLVATLAHLAA